MRRRMSFWIIGMLLSLLPTTAFSSDGLTFNYTRTEGQAYYDLPLTIYVNVTNNGAEDYYGWWSIGNKANWENFQSVEIKTGETKEVAFETIIAQTGNVTLSIFDLTSDQPLYTFTIQVDKAQPKISGSVHLNLQETPDKGLCMFCDFKNIRIYGSATITNGELFDIYEKSPTAIGYRDSYFKTVLMPQIGDKLIKSSLIGMPEVIKGGETVNVNISINFEGTPEEGQEYVVQILYMDMVIASSEPFTFIRSTNTYWTADGNQRPLSVGDDNTLMVPKEALAVDLRGIYTINTVYKIDVSEANPNCLYYLGFLDYVPHGFMSETNIIRDGEASTVIIDSDYDYYCPVPFKTKTALFTYTPVSESMGPASPVMSQKMSGLITLPFTAQNAWLKWANEDSRPANPFYNEDLKMARLFFEDDGTAIFEPLTKYQPDAFSCYLLYDFKPSPVVFSAEDNVVIPSRPYIAPLTGGYIFQERWTSTMAEKYTYSWNCDKNSISLNKEGAILRPFNAIVGKWDEKAQAFIDTGQEELPYYLKEPVGIESPRRTPDDKTIYTLYGQRVGTATYTGGRLNTEGLKPGLYLVDGKKVVVK